MHTSLLTNATVRLTSLTHDDLPTLVRWHADAEFLRLLDARPARPRHADELRTWLDEQRDARDALLFGVRRLDQDELVGYAMLDGILWTHRTAWVTLAIGDRAHQGRGYGYAALQLLVRFAFGELNLHRLQLTVFSYNTRAIQIYERLGFQREGIYREFLERDGQRYDMYLYGLLRHEWSEEATPGQLG